ncbi:related to ubiquitin carboxyl-terminal hydrolase 36 [Ustilago sp. UG-2017a]|nr:related to ubiquitin carboxyl-terminal hydrolase 36 [Ustilago sp. UG-2017a]
MAEVVRRPPSQDERNGSSSSPSSSRSFSQSPQVKGLNRSHSFSSSRKPSKKSANGHHYHKKASSLPNSPSKEERKKLAKEFFANASDQLRATLKQRGMLHALLSDPVKFIKSNQKQGQDYTTLGLIPVNDPNFAAAQKRKQEQKQHSLLLHTDTPKLNGASAAIEEQEPSSPSKKSKARGGGDLYSQKISLRFPGKVRSIATGLSNYGNTCYMNSVMQSLIHTPPLAFALLTQDLETLHGEWGGKPNVNFDAVIAMQNFAKRSLQGTRPTNAPQEFNRNLKAFAKPLRQGRQEDAHEYLRFLLEALQQACLSRAPKSLKPDNPIRRTTFVQKMFGGKLRSRVTCHNCSHNSDTFDPFMDLSLEVRKGINSLTDAFCAFVAKDHLTGSEKYKCDKCKRKVDATKQFTIESSPPALTVHLKRFTAFGGKISRQISFDESLNIAPYLSENRGPVRYKLYAAVHHYGSGPNSGHYNDGLEKAIKAVATSQAPLLKRKAEEAEEERSASEESEEEEKGDDFDDVAAYQALLKRRKAEKKAAEDESDSDEAPTKSASSKLDAMLASKPKSAASFYGGAASRVSNPFTMASAAEEELGTPIERDEYESLVGPVTLSSSTPSSPTKSNCNPDPELESESEPDSFTALSKKEKRKQKKAAQAILSAKSSRGIPSSPYASALTGIGGAKEQKKKSKKDQKAISALGGFAGRMKPRFSH